MEITLNDCTLLEAQEEIEFQRSRGREAYFKGKGDGTVVIEVLPYLITKLPRRTKWT